MRKMTAKEKQRLLGLLDWFFSSLEEDTGARTVAKIPAEYNGDESFSDSGAPLHSAALVPERMRPQPRQHPDASVAKPIPELAGFVPSAVANGSASVPTGQKTDTGGVRRI